MDLLTAIGIFVVTLFVIEGGYLAFRKIRNPEVKRVRKRLSTLTLAEYQTEDVDIIRRKLLSEIPWFNRILLSLRRTDRANRLLEQAGTQYHLGFYILLSLVLAAVGFLVVSWLTSNLLVSIIVAAILGMMPFFYIHSKKKRRMQKFERQLPDAMDLIARSLRAGHAFTGGLKMVADEFDDPMGTEFDKTLNEINFGVGVVEGLKTLANRVDCRDLKFFVISVILQRETGGNLAEILENIARLIRERFKLHGHIRVLAAEGKLSAIILVALPFVVALALFLINPEYIRTLITDPLGKIMTVFAISMMVVGIFIMRRMIKIKV
jgi:tight adherence protein B